MVVCSELQPDCNNNLPVPNAEFFKTHHFGAEFVHKRGKSKAMMNDNNNSKSNITQDDNNYDANRYSIKAFYRNAVILLTGGTGFLGKVLIEKLLRSCDNIRCIYILLRAKRGLSSEQRHKELMQNPVFDRIREQNPDILKKLIFIAGDIAKPNIGLSSDDLQMLKDTVNIVFHSAATVRFDQSIKEAANMNTLGSKRLWDLCVEMKNLKSIIHVSTAYTNPKRKFVGEMIYPPQIAMDNDTFMACVNTLPDDLVHSIANSLQGDHPNTYTLTKSMAEQIAADYHHRLPITIIRPSIVTGSYAEPFPGWVDNINGITGIIMEIGRGTISSIMCDNKLILDIIPVDIACNMIIAAAWQNYYQPTNSIRVYNCTSGQMNTLMWEDCRQSVLNHSRKYPSKYVMMYPNCSYRTNRFTHRLYEIFLHFLPAFLFDCYMKSQGNKPVMLNIAKRYKAAADTGEFFAMHEWEFEVTNVHELINEIKKAHDRDEFSCDVAKVNWDQYLKMFVLGIRKYILKDDDTTLEKSRNTLNILFTVKWVIQIAFLLLFYFLLQKLFW